MRKHRYALRIILAIAFVLAAVSLSTVLGTSTAATSTSPKESCSPCASSHTRSSLIAQYKDVSYAIKARAEAATPPPPEVQDAQVIAVAQQQRAQLVAFAQAVNTYRLVSYTTAVTAAEEFVAREAAEESSASEQPMESMSPSVTTTPTPVPSSGDNSSIWNCIEQHESNFEPTAYNPSSGAAGSCSSNLGHGSLPPSSTSRASTQAEPQQPPHRFRCKRRISTRPSMVGPRAWRRLHS